MNTHTIQYRLFVTKNIRQICQSFVLVVGLPLNYYPIFSSMLSYFQNLELVHIGELFPFLLLLKPTTTDNLTLFISSDIIDNYHNILHTLTGITYIFDTKRNIIYKANNYKRQITAVTNPLIFESRGRRGFFQLSTEIGQYIWYRLFFSVLSSIEHTETSKKEFLAYVDQKPRRQETE